MTVQTMAPPPLPTRAPATVATTTATTTTTKTTLNRRFPPLADRSSLPHRLTGLSRQKLAREATAPDPDVRRCLAHFRMHVASMEWTSKDVRSQISSVELEEEEEEEEEDEDANQKARELEERLSRQSGVEVKKEEGEESDESQPQPQQSSPAPDVVRVSFHVPRPGSNDDESIQQEPEQQQPAQPPSPPRKDDGILERSRSCLEKSGQKKHFWLSSGQCVPVRIAS